MKTTTKSPSGERLSARSLRSVNSQIKSLSKRVDSLNEKIVIVGDGLFGGTLPLKLKPAKTAKYIFVDQRLVGVVSPGSGDLIMIAERETSLNPEQLEHSDKSERPTGYACDPDSPEFNEVLMKCFADGKRKALKEAKQHASKSKRK